LVGREPRRSGVEDAFEIGQSRLLQFLAAFPFGLVLLLLAFVFLSPRLGSTLLFFLILLSLLFIVALANFRFFFGLDFRRWRNRRGRVGGLFLGCSWIVNWAIVVRANGERGSEVLAVNDDGWLRGCAWQGWLRIGVVNDGFYLTECAATNGTWPLLGGLSPTVFDLDKLGPRGELAVEKCRDLGLVAISVKALVALNVIEEGSVVSAAAGAGRASSGSGVEGRVFAVEGRFRERKIKVRLNSSG
jgi:hypothetical protein